MAASGLIYCLAEVVQAPRRILQTNVVSVSGCVGGHAARAREEVTENQRSLWALVGAGDTNNGRQRLLF